jgi:hypothetical protein
MQVSFCHFSYHPPYTRIDNGTMTVIFFNSLNFVSPPDLASGSDYVILTHPSGVDVHLRLAEPGWVVEGTNPFGVYLYVAKEEVDRLAVVLKVNIIGKVKRAEKKEWGMYEFALNGPDGCLVRVGCKADE